MAYKNRRDTILLGRGEVLITPDLFGMLNFGKSRNLHFTIIIKRGGYNENISNPAEG